MSNKRDLPYGKKGVDEDIIIRIIRYLAIPAIDVLVRFNVKPNVITVISVIPYLIAGILLVATQQYVYLIIAAILVQLGHYIDALDGGVARLTGTTSKFGKWLDNMMDIVGYVFLIVCIGVRVYLDRSDFLGFLIPLGFTAGVLFNTHLSFSIATIFPGKKGRKKVKPNVKQSFFAKHGIREGAGTSRLALSIAMVTDLFVAMSILTAYALGIGFLRMLTNGRRFWYQ